MIQCINDVSDVFAHVTANIVISCKKFRRLISKVSSNNTVDDAVCNKVSTIKEMQIYVKPEEYAAYYVINGVSGRINLF